MKTDKVRVRVYVYTHARKKAKKDGKGRIESKGEGGDDDHGEHKLGLCLSHLDGGSSNPSLKETLEALS